MFKDTCDASLPCLSSSPLLPPIHTSRTGVSCSSPKEQVLKSNVFPMTLVHTPLHNICQQRKAVGGHSNWNPLQPYLTTHSPFYSLLMGLCAHLFQIIAHFRLLIKGFLNFYLQMLADPLNLFWDPKRLFWDLSQPWIDSGLPCRNFLLRLKGNIDSYCAFQ